MNVRGHRQSIVYSADPIMKWTQSRALTIRPADWDLHDREPLAKGQSQDLDIEGEPFHSQGGEQGLRRSPLEEFEAALRVANALRGKAGSSSKAPAPDPTAQWLALLIGRTVDPPGSDDDGRALLKQGPNRVQALNGRCHIGIAEADETCLAGQHAATHCGPLAAASTVDQVDVDRQSGSEVRHNVGSSVDAAVVDDDYRGPKWFL